ncbi:hypothetical protein JQ636_12480 [Bradyrhizobium japonicum]|uniref:hypothetical protein n=1 Tax=Bradyrhizobium japonicum TaxID=375 RepID=UPI001BA90B9D|nr:hypothetical protein [Bradyrhizobium japonicum]MBR0804357.1 hypothetical protein [Bradyrhizobium japonicum]
MPPRAPLARASGRNRPALRSDASPRSRVVAPLSRIFRRVRSQGPRPSQRAVAARDGGVVVLAPRLSFILNLFETLTSSPARNSHVQRFVSDGASRPEPSAFAASVKTWAASIADIRAGRLAIAPWDVNFAPGRIMSRLDHRSSQAGIRAFFGRLAKPATSPRRAVAADGSGREGGQLRTALLPRIGPLRHGPGPFSPVETSVAPASAQRSGNPFRPRINVPEVRAQSLVGSRRGLIETLSVTGKRYREATEIGPRSHLVTADEKFRAVTAVTLTYRTTKEGSPAPMPPQATRSEPPPRPVIDADRLGREIWQQMGRRLRIERERRGKL